MWRRREAAGRNARRALRITATSITSCTIAAATGTSHPVAAASIASIDSPMPTPMLSTAMRRARCAMTIASPTRSSRSARITTSAASEEALAPRAPIAMPTSAAASAGASLIPSPTMTVGLMRCSVRTASTLSEGTRSANTTSKSRAAPMVCAAAARSPVIMPIRATPAARKASDRARRIGTQFIGEQERADRPFVDGEEHHQSRAPRGAARGAQRPCVGRTMSKDDVVGTGAHAFAFDKAIEAGTGGLAHVLGHRQRQAAVQRRGHDRRGDHVMRGLLERGAEPQDLVGMFVRRNLDRQQARTAHRQRAGLVEQHRIGPRQRLKRSSAFDQNAAPRSLRDPAMKATGAARMRGQGVAATSTARPRIMSPEKSQATLATASVNGRKNSA